MKHEGTSSKIKVGLFIIVGAILLTVLIFKMGNRKNPISDKKILVSIFKDVEGLKEGSDVRFAGVNIGIVDEIAIVSDSSVKVTLKVQDKLSRFVKKDSRAEIRTEGMIGNQYINLVPGNLAEAKDGDTIRTQKVFGLENVVATFNETTEKVKVVLTHVESITAKADSNVGPLGALIGDEKMKNDLTQLVGNLNEAGKKANTLVTKMNGVPEKMQRISTNMISISDSIKKVSNNAIDASENFETFARNLNNKETTIGKVVTDTAFGNQIEQTIGHVDAAASDLKETSTKVRGSFFVRLFNNDKSD